MRNSRLNQPQISINHDRVIGRFAKKLTIILSLRLSLTIITLWCFAWGTLALVLRAAAGVQPKHLWWGLTGLLAAVIAAIIIARRQSPSRSAIRALLDRQNACGGLLMTEADAKLGDWQDRIPQINLPKIRWKSSRAWGLFAASAVFVGVCLFVPVRFASMNTGRALDVGREAADLAEKIGILKEEQFIEETKAETLEQKLDQLSKEASGEEPVKTWEALDHLSDAVEKAAKEAAESAVFNQEKLARAEALAEGLIQGGDKMDSELMTESMQTLSKMMQDAMRENQSLANDLSAETKEAIKSGALKSENLKDISRALSQNRSALNKKLSRLNQAGMIDSKSLKGGAQGGKRDHSGLAQFLKENAERMSVEDAIEAWGKGGVDRGRGDAAMTWTDGSKENGAKFKEKQLPPSAVAGLKESELVGLSASAPDVETGVAAHGALNRAAKGGGSAYTQTVLPKHKGSVKRYFERSQNR